MNSWSGSCSPLVSNFVNILRYYGKYIFVILYKNIITGKNSVLHLVLFQSQWEDFEQII